MRDRILLTPTLGAIARAAAFATALALVPQAAGATEADPWGGMRAAGESPKGAPAAVPAASPATPARPAALPRDAAPAAPAAQAPGTSERPATTALAAPLAIPFPRPRPADAPGAVTSSPPAAPAPELAGRAVFDAEADGEGLAPGMFDAAVNAFPPPSAALPAPSPPAAAGTMGALQAAMFPSALAAPVAPSVPLSPATPAPAEAPQAAPPAALPAAAPSTPPAPGALAHEQPQAAGESHPESQSHPEGQVDPAHADGQAPEQEAAHAQDHAAAATGHGDSHGTAAHEPPRDTRPVDLLRRLQRLQDRLAAGTSEGLPAQRDLISQIDAAYAGFPQEVWQDERNARALAVYFLSGGTPGVLRKILDREPAPAGDIRMLRGILAYAEGRGEEALRFLGEVDARAQPNVLGGQIALAQAALVVRQDPAKASDLLDLARLLLPGTLVEEAALRRQILVESQSADISRFQRLTRQYLFRFRHSVYAGNFRQRFAAALTRMPFVNDPAQFGRLDEMLKPIEPEGRRDIYLLIARAALTQGRTTAAALCAERTLALAPPASLDAERARLYGAAATAASASGYAAALKTLAAVDRSRLDPSDIALLDAAREAAGTVRDASRVSVQAVPAVAPAPAAASAPVPVAAPVTMPVAAPASPPAIPVAASTTAPAPSASPPAAPAPQTEETDAVKGARAKLEAVDALLKEAPR